MLSGARYAFDYYNTVRPYECWFTLLLIFASLLYIILTFVVWPATLHRVKDFFKRLVSPAQILCVVFFLLYIVSCAANTIFNGEPWFQYNDWWLLDAFLNCVVLFSLPHIFSEEKAKKIIDIILFVVSTAGTLAAFWALWNLFHLNIVLLPSGAPVGMSPEYEFYFGCHYNITAATALCFILICFYMIATQGWNLKAVYIFALIPHTMILLLTNSRTAFVACLSAYASALFLIVWNKFSGKEKKYRIILSILASFVAVCLLCAARPLSFKVFDSVTHFSEQINNEYLSQGIAIQEDEGEQFTRSINGMMNRSYVWYAARTVMVSDPKITLFGTTPYGAPDALSNFDGEYYPRAHAHNEILQMGVSLGIPAMVLFIIFLGLIGIKSIRLGLIEGNKHFKGAYILPVVFLALFVLTLGEAYLFGYFSIMGCLFFLFSGWIDSLVSFRKDTAREGKKHLDFKNPRTQIWIVFIAAVIVHAIVNLSVKKTITVIIDEGLYTNIARSLAWDHEIAYRAQPVNYQYILYPLLLVPLYWIRCLIGGDIFRLIQIFNTVLICSSVFPAYLFAFEFTGDRKKALITAIFVAIFPDMLMGGFAMAESLIWPLAFWMTLFTWRYYRDGLLRDGMLSALFTGLMFAAKPGAIAVGAVMLLSVLLMNIRKDHPRIRSSIISVTVLLFIVAAVYAVYMVLSPDGMPFAGLYQKQTSNWTSKTVLVMLEAFLLQVFIFVFACGGIFGILPVVYRAKYPEKERNFVTAFLIGVTVALLGTAVFIVPFRWDDSLGRLPLHLRYTSMFIPVMLVFSLAVPEDSKSFKRSLVTALSLFILLAVFPGARAGVVDSRTGEIDLLTLAAFLNIAHLNGNITGTILTAVMVLFLLYVLFNVFEKGWTAQIRKYCLVYFGVFLLFNSVCACIVSYSDIDSTILSDAKELNVIADGKLCLGITQRNYNDFYSHWLDSRLNLPMQQVTSDQMFVETNKNGGLYIPFVPEEQLPNVNNRETPDTNRFVLGQTIAEHLELSKYTTAKKTKNGYYTYVEITPDKRWVDSMMYGLDDNMLYDGLTAYIGIYDDMRNRDGTLDLTITASGSGNLIIGKNKLTLFNEPRTYDVNIPFTDLVQIRAAGGNAEILSYETHGR